MTARKAKRRPKVQPIKPDAEMQQQWDKAAQLIDKLDDLIGEIPRFTIGHPDSGAQFNDLIAELKAAVSSLSAIRRWELQRFNRIPVRVREEMCDAVMRS